MIHGEIVSKLMTAETPDVIVSAHEHIQIVRMRCERLPPRERDAIKAKFGMMGETTEKVAERYGVTTETAREWARAAEARLRIQLASFITANRDCE